MSNKLKRVFVAFRADVAMPVTEVDRNTIIKIALCHVIRIVGHYYPEASTKEKLAAAIVAAFPQMGLIRDGLVSGFASDIVTFAWVE